MADAHGRSVGVRALRRRQGSGDVEVVVSAPVAVPAGWRRGDDRLCGLVVPEDAPIDRQRSDGRTPVLAAFDGPDRAVVAVDVCTVGWLGVPSAWLVPVGDAIVHSGLVSGLDVVLFGVAPGDLESPGARLHVASDADDLEHLVGQLVGDDEPVVVVAAGVDAAAVRRALDLGAAVVSDGDERRAGANVIAAAGRWRLDPPGWPVDAVRSPPGFVRRPGYSPERSAPDARSAAISAGA